MVSAELKLTTSPVLGPQGLTIATPDTVEPITTKDLFEVLRWMREDLLKIHRAFAYVHQLRAEMTTVKAIHVQQKLEYKNQSDAVQRLSEQYQSVADQVEQQSEAISQIVVAQTQLATTLTDAITALSGMVLDIDNRSKLPWWKKVLG